MTKTPLGCGDWLLRALLFVLVGFYGIWLFGPLLAGPTINDIYALRVNCTSHLRQVLTASLIYCEDHEGRLPPQGHWEVTKPSGGLWIMGDQMAWRQALQPYHKSDDLFFSQGWPYREREGTRLQLVRGVTNGASCYGYVAEITPKWFGSKDGSLHLNPADPPEGFLKELGVDQANAPLLEDLAWIEKGRFGQVHIYRILDKSTRPGQKVVGYMDGHVKTIPATESGQAEPSKLR